MAQLHTQCTSHAGESTRRLLSTAVLLLAAVLVFPALQRPAAQVASSAPVQEQIATIERSLGAFGVRNLQVAGARTSDAPQATAPTGDALLASLRTDIGSQWLKNHRETALRSGPEDKATLFTTLPQWTDLRVLQTRGTWIQVWVNGDRTGRQPGPGWVKASDVGAVSTPMPWLSTTHAATLWKMGSGAGRGLDLPAETRLEIVGPDWESGKRIHVRLPGNGGSVPPSEGWIEAADATRAVTPAASQLPAAYPLNVQAAVRLPIQYRTQLDGTPYAEANCGPASLGMAMSVFGVNVPLGPLREQVLVAQDMNPSDADSGSFVWALGSVAESYGLQAVSLYESDGQTLHRWTVDDVRQQVKQGRPVVLQARYRALPGHEDIAYYGDHFVVVTGLVGDNFLYDDPIPSSGSKAKPGWDRVMTPAQLDLAMNASDQDFAYTGFAVARGGETVAEIVTRYSAE